MKNTTAHLMEIEIKRVINPATIRADLVDNHSLLNLFNVLQQQLNQLHERTRFAHIIPFLDFSVEILLRIGEEDISVHYKSIEESFWNLGKVCMKALDQHPEESQLINAILEIVEVGSERLQELLTDRFEWKPVPVKKIRSLLFQFFDATQIASLNRFSVVYDKAEHNSSSYYLSFSIDTPEDSVVMPYVLNDVIRDLVANARKYASPGTSIYVQLKQHDDQSLELTVTDQGMGIPFDEIEYVTDFGYRASNATKFSTMGGGFGLTKAYIICKRFKGRFFIDSAVGKGTKIRFSLQKPDLI